LETKLETHIGNRSETRIGNRRQKPERAAAPSTCVTPPRRPWPDPAGYSRSKVPHSGKVVRAAKRLSHHLIF